VKYTTDSRAGWMSTSIKNFSTWSDEYNVKHLRQLLTDQTIQYEKAD